MDQIKRYWEDRAQQNAGATTATTLDVHLRELEIRSFVAALERLLPVTLFRAPEVLDVGCGDGYSTAAIARAIDRFRFRGIDYAENMITSARSRLSAEPQLRGRLQFEVADATQLDRALGASLFDAVLTDRCLINLHSSGEQYQAIKDIARHLHPGGYYVAVENFVEGQNAMNEARATVGLPPIPVRWHNHFFVEDEFREQTAKDFDLLSIEEFSSSYYFATRVVYAAMCKMRNEEPDYNHEIHQFAPHLPVVGAFSPIRMVVMRRKAG